MVNCKCILLFPNFNLFSLFSVIPHQPSLSLAYLAGTLDKQKILYEIIDAAAENLSFKKTKTRIDKFNPDYIGITTNVAIAYAAIQTAIFIRKYFPRVKIVMGGPWAATQAAYLIKHNYADIVVLGEGEDLFAEIAQTSPDDSDGLSKIKGICLKTPDGFITTSLRPLIENLDELPFPKWKGFPKIRYSQHSREKRLYPLIASRGCPYRCKNCCKVIHGYRLRYRSIENILQELDYLKAIGAREIVIEDDMLNLDLKRVKALFLAIIKKRYNFRIQLSNGIRADRVDSTFASLLYAAGVYRVALGIESGSQKVVDFLEKKLDLNVVPTAVSILHQAHIKVIGYFIMGLPNETLQSLIYTITYADRINLDVFAFFTFVPFPGTPIYDYLIKKTNYNPNKLVVGPQFNYQHAPMVFTTKELTAKNMKKVKIYYLIRAYGNPRNFFRYVASLTFSECIRQMAWNFKIVIKRVLFPSLVHQSVRLVTPQA